MNGLYGKNYLSARAAAWCLADQECKASVTIVGVGTLALHADGSVTVILKT